MQTKQQEKKRLSILGATGTIGQNTLDLVARNSENFQIVSLTGNDNVKLLAKVAKQFAAEFVATASTDNEKYNELKRELSGTGIECASGREALKEAASRKTDITMAAIVGVAGLEPTIEALKATNCLALANKECLVSAGELFMNSARDLNTTIIPVDSEHSAAFQCLQGEKKQDLEKLILTASGGPFHKLSLQELQKVTKMQALKHPNWDMGAKITIDSATLMNKGLELIEAKYLFELEPKQLDMVVHTQSIIHCLMNFIDGSVLAQLSEPDMRVPIAYALGWPNRIKTPINPINLTEIGQLTFERGDEQRFPCLRLAKNVLHNAQTLGPVLNAANEIAVEAFLKDQISFVMIPEVIEKTIEECENQKNLEKHHDLNDILALDGHARNLALQLLKMPV